MTELEQAELREVDERRWRETAPRFHDFNYEQSWGYARAAAARVGAQAEFCLIESGGEALAAANVRVKKVPGLGRGIAYIASGPMLCPPGSGPVEADKIRRVVELLRQEYVDDRGHILRFRLPASPHYSAQDVDAALAGLSLEPTEQVKPYRTFVVDLEPEPEALKKSLQYNWRRHLNASLRNELTLEIGDDQAFVDRFMRLYAIVRETKGFESDIDPTFFFGLDDPDFKLKILLAQKDGVDIGGLVLGLAGQTAIYNYGATDATGRDTKAGFFLTWNGFLHAREMGARWYDLGGVDETENPEGFKFKKRTGGEYIDAAGPYQANPSMLAAHAIQGAEKAFKLVRRLR